MSGKGTWAETERVGDRTVRVVLFPVNLITSWSGLRENPRLLCWVNNRRVQSIESDREAIYRLNNTALNRVRPTIDSILLSKYYDRQWLCLIAYREYFRKSQIMPKIICFDDDILIEPLKKSIFCILNGEFGLRLRYMLIPKYKTLKRSLILLN